MMFVFLLCGTPEYALVIEGDVYQVVEVPDGAVKPPEGIPTISLEELTGHMCV